MTDDTIAELRAEIVALAAQRDAIDARLAALATVLGEVVSPRCSPRVMPAGLRAAAIGLLAEQGPMRAAAVARILIERGFTSTANTKLSTLIYNDLWRLSRKGVVVADGSKFSLRSLSHSPERQHQE